MTELKREVEQLMAERDCQAEMVATLRSSNGRASIGRGDLANSAKKRQSNVSAAAAAEFDSFEESSRNIGDDSRASLEVERLNKEIERIRADKYVSIVLSLEKTNSDVC